MVRVAAAAVVVVEEAEGGPFGMQEAAAAVGAVEGVEVDKE